MNGRKRHLLVDTGGLLLIAQVHPANIADRAEAQAMLTALHVAHPGITQVWADAGYTGPQIAWAKQELCLTLRIQSRRWVIERTFVWWGRSRRLSEDYEGLAEIEAGGIHLAMVRLMVARLAL